MGGTKSLFSRKSDGHLSAHTPQMQRTCGIDLNGS